MRQFSFLLLSLALPYPSLQTTGRSNPRVHVMTYVHYQDQGLELYPPRDHHTRREMPSEVNTS